MPAQRARVAAAGWAAAASLALLAASAAAVSVAAAEEPVAVVAIGEAAEAGSFVQLADKPDDFCAPGTMCPKPGMVCCRGGTHCCRYGCDDQKNRPVACKPNPKDEEKLMFKMARKMDKASKKLRRETVDVQAKAIRQVGDAKARLDQCRIELSHVKDDAKAARLAVRRAKNKCSARVRSVKRKCAAAASPPVPGTSSASRASKRRRNKRWGGRKGRKGRKNGRGRTGKGKKRGLDAARLKTYTPDKLVRIVQSMYRQRQVMRRRLRKAGVVRRFGSCKEIKRRNPKARTGRYVIRLRRGHLHTVHCDMDTDGGGWTALLNPASFPTAVFPGLLFEPTTVSGTETCGGSDFVRQRNGWNTIYHYKCGNVVTRSHYRWANVLGATDVMLRATLQGETERHMSINGRYVGFTGLDTPKTGAPSAGSCAFYTGAGEWTTPTGINKCAGTAVPAGVKPLVLRGWMAPSQQLNLKMQAGRAALPNPQYGTGWNIATLMVR